MYFSSQQQAAILSLSKALTMCDGHFAEAEKIVLVAGLERIGVTNIDSTIAAAEKMDAATACSIISKLPATEKKYVCALFGTIIAADMDLKDEELALWAFISTVCDFPKMGVKQAVEYMANV